MSALARTPASRGMYLMTVLAQPAPAVPASAAPARQMALSAKAVEAWVYMRDQGGYWTPNELGLALLPGLSANRASMSAGRWLSALIKRSHVVLNPNVRGVQSFGVTARCRPVPGYSLAPKPCQPYDLAAAARLLIAPSF